MIIEVYNFIAQTGLEVSLPLLIVTAFVSYWLKNDAKKQALKQAFNRYISPEAIKRELPKKSSALDVVKVTGILVGILAGTLTCIVCVIQIGVFLGLWPEVLHPEV